MSVTMELNILSTYENALMLRAQRNEVLAANIANADTPGYKARDIDFRAAMSSALDGGSMSMTTTSAMHQQSPAMAAGWQADVAYRVPTQSTLDGNTVETDVEQAQYAENALQYRVALSFIDSQIRSIRYALKGGE